MRQPMIAEAKAMMRKEMRDRRRSFVLRADMGALAVPEQWSSLISANDNIALYAAVNTEISADLLAVACHDVGAAILLPRLTRFGTMDFAIDNGRLVPGDRGIPEPHGDNPTAIPTIIVCPLLAFDRYGGRLGQGGGHYDRAFARYPDARRIGLAWSVQQVERVPVDAHDIMLDVIITERDWIVP